MPPASILTHRDRARQRLMENVRQAVLNASCSDGPIIDAIVQGCAQGDISIPDAHVRVLVLRREQRLRLTRAA